MEEERKSWEQMVDKGEPDLWYGRFVKYLRLGTKRSVNALYVKEAKTARNSEKQRELEAGGDWYKAEKEWNWKERARVYDLEQEKQRREEEEKQREEDLEAVRKMLLSHIQAEVDKSSTSQIQAARLLIEHYATSDEIAQIKEQMDMLQETLKSLGAEL